jgi:uncharacterized protein YgiM (DUF1202 family)
MSTPTQEKIMLRLTSALTAGIYMTMVLLGDGNGTGQIAAAQADVVARSATEQTQLPRVSVSDEEAIKIAVAATVAPAEVEEKAELTAKKISTADEIVDDRKRLYVTGNVVNMRSGPSTRNPVLGQLKLGTEAVVLRELDNGWTKIKDETGTVGYMSAKYLAEDKPRG